ncbi:unnamed protein product [Protopolystoma xenopodis]|uniref:Uncharacterized protein n=1 Tax=Protopolystoma xenopodis TaxID=117903 RepID=A0A3S5CIH4_9PLAT|nr:unnamed protein product [Protopolystoma xenopodis]
MRRSSEVERAQPKDTIFYSMHQRNGRKEYASEDSINANWAKLVKKKRGKFEQTEEGEGGESSLPERYR